MAELSQQYRAAAEERYGKGGGSASAVAKRGIEYAKKHPAEAASYVISGGVAGAGVKYGVKQLIKKLPELSKKIRTKLGSKKIKKTEFKGTKDKSAKQQAEEARNKYEKVVLRKEIKIDKRFKKGNVNRKKNVTVGSYEPTWTAVGAQQLPKLKVGAGIVAGGIVAKDQYAKTTVGAAKYPDQHAKDDSIGKITTDKKKKSDLSGKSMLKSSANKPNGRVTMTSTIPQKNEINWGTGKPRNNTSTVSAKSINNKPYSYPRADEIISDYRKSKNKYKSVQDGGKLQDWVGDDHRQNAYKTGGSNKTSTSVASNYTRTRDDRGTRVEKDTRRANVSGTNARLQRNGKSKTKVKKRSTSSGIPSFVEMVHKQRKIRSKRY